MTTQHLSQAADLVQRLGTIRQVQQMVTSMPSNVGIRELVDTFIQIELSDLLQKYLEAKRVELEERIRKRQSDAGNGNEQTATIAPALLDAVKNADPETVYKATLILSALNARDSTLPLLLLLLPALAGGGQQQTQQGSQQNIIGEVMIKLIDRLLQQPQQQTQQHQSELEVATRLLDMLSKYRELIGTQQQSQSVDPVRQIEYIEKLAEKLGFVRSVDVKKLELELEKTRLELEKWKTEQELKLRKWQISKMIEKKHELRKYAMLEKIAKAILQPFMRPIGEKIAEKVVNARASVPNVPKIRVRCTNCGRDVILKNDPTIRWKCPYCGADLEHLRKTHAQKQ